MIRRRVKTNIKDGAQMIYIPEGEFLRGSPEGVGFENEHPQHRVCLSGYWLYATPVTVAQYRRFCEETGYPMPPEPSWGWRDTHPVVNVTWWEACRYSVWAGGRLPTEAEWEKAARWDPNTGGSLIYPWGDEWDAWRCNNVITGPGMTSDVWTYEEGRSPSGLWDMAGNVWEWCLDIYDDQFYAHHPASDAWDNPVNGSLLDCAIVSDLLDRYRQDKGLGGDWREGFGQWLRRSDETNVYHRLRLLRGGSWSHLNQSFLRCACRFLNNLRYDLWGFRVAVEDCFRRGPHLCLNRRTCGESRGSLRAAPVPRQWVRTNNLSARFG